MRLCCGRKVVPAAVRVHDSCHTARGCTAAHAPKNCLPAWAPVVPAGGAGPCPSRCRDVVSGSIKEAFEGQGPTPAETSKGTGLGSVGR